MADLEALMALKRLWNKLSYDMPEVTNLDVRGDRVTLKDYLHAAAVPEAAYLRDDHSLICRFYQNGQVRVWNCQVNIVNYTCSAGPIYWNDWSYFDASQLCHRSKFLQCVCTYCVDS